MFDERTAWRMRTETARQFLRDMGLEAVAFLTPGPYQALEEFLLDRGWEPERARRYASPVCHLEDVRCVVTALFPYYAGEENGNLSLYCRGLDYHSVIRTYFDRLLAYLRRELAEFEIHARVCADTGPVVDRYLALRGGLARGGRNQLLYRDGMGSYFFIGSLLVNLPFETEDAEPRTADACESCDRCIRSCPGGALTQDGRFDSQRCRSAITQKKGELAVWERSILEKDTLIFGCDICQRVCPMNQNLAPSALPEFESRRITAVTEDDLRSLSSRQFQERYGDRAFAWRGKQILLRNLSVVAEQNRHSR